MALVDVGHVAAYTGGLNAQVGWLGWRVGGRPARWPTFVKMNGWTLAVAIGHDDSTINIVFDYYYYYKKQYDIQNWDQQPKYGKNLM